MNYLKKSLWKMGKMDGLSANVGQRIPAFSPFVESNLRVREVGEKWEKGQVGMQIAHSPFGMKNTAYMGGR